MPSAPALAKKGNPPGWNATANTPSSAFFLCTVDSWMHARVLSRSQKRTEQSWPDVTRVKPLESIERDVTESVWASIECVHCSVKQRHC